MKVWRTVQEAHKEHKPSGFVPTMGALHEGHLELVRRAKAESGYCVVSIFVNPTQFGPNEDFAKYPRDEKRDFELAASAGADAIFAPSVEEMYTHSQAEITIKGVTSRWEGEIRPGHFTGVATVVAKLFNIVRPLDAYFGLKDFQQCAVVASLVQSLRFDVNLKFLETVREADGLAMSSRNRYLSSEHRQIAPKIYAELNELKLQFERGSDLESSIQESVNRLNRTGFDVQYLALVDSITLEPVTQYKTGARLIVAAKLGTTRLIDNIGV